MKFDMTLARLMAEPFLVEPNFANAVLDNILAFREGNPSDTHTELANESVTYQLVGDVAVIGVDGPMYKKDMSGMCMSVASYDQLIQAQDKAEKDRMVSKILYRVDTPGGSVAGLEEFRQRIEDSSKEVLVYAENTMASAGMYAFTPAKKIYANESTVLGSIGVIVMYEEPKSKTFAIVSSSAPNKYCNIESEECKSKIQNRLDQYENIFLSKLESAFPDKSREQIVQDFDRGGTIFAQEAKNLGYVTDIMPFQTLLRSLVEDETLSSEKTANTQLQAENIDKGFSMTVEELQAQLTDANTTIEAKTTEIDGLTATIEGLNKVSAVAKMAVTVGMQLGASQENILAAMEEDSTEKAENLLYKSVMSGGAITTGEDLSDEDKAKATAKAEDDALMEYAQKHKVRG